MRYNKYKNVQVLCKAGVMWMDVISGFIPYEIKTSIVKITSYANRQLRGTLTNPYFEHEMCFDNAIQFLVLVEELLNSLGYPQQAMERRTFRSVKPVYKLETACDACAPALATFRLNVLFRQSASWQGQLVWVEEKCEAQFRSVLELLMLMDNVLS